MNLEYTNRLIHESSPYLKQHAHNPVDWYPWGAEAWERAKFEDKPVIVSIGYSACHWCHVMERESFESPELAAIMNKFFINIKVDREERPDVDSIYMDALHSMGLRGGWPLNVMLMPDGKPFYGGTYFPPEKWRQILLAIAQGFEHDREKLQSSADGFAENLQTSEAQKYRLAFVEEPNIQIEKAALEDIQRLLLRSVDFKKGGLSRSPKFPMPAVWSYLLQSQANHPNQESQDAIFTTLDRMALGGLFDHIAGGWTRYSTDEDWKVPHFEKMLYDNGQLLSVYAQGILLARQHPDRKPQERLYTWAIEQTVSWLKSEMQSPSGGLYAALDADSEGVEGKYYTWTEEELDEILDEDMAWFGDMYDITDQGNWEHGNNILHLEEYPSQSNWSRWMSILQKLKPIREQRIRPGLDDKILANWNGLAIKGLVDAYFATQNPLTKELALEVGECIRQHFLVNVQNESGEDALGLTHVLGKNIIGFLDDYAAVMDAFLSLYKLTLDDTWILDALKLADYVVANFYDPSEQLFFFTDSQGEELIARKKELFDNVIPASNSMIAHAFWKLGELTDRTDLSQISQVMVSKMAPLIAKDPQWLAHWANLQVQMHHGLPVVVVDSSQPFQAIRPFVETFLPEVLYLSADSHLPLAQGKKGVEGKTTYFLCQNQSCLAPTTSWEETLKSLQLR